MRDSGEAPSKPSSRRIARSEIGALLAPTLGPENSDELVASTARSLGYLRLDAFDAKQATAILQALAVMEGIVGTVARFALARKDFAALIVTAADEDAPPASSQEPTPSAWGVLADAPPSSRSGVHRSGAESSRTRSSDAIEAVGPLSAGRISINTLVELLSHSLSKEVARAGIQECATRLGLGDLILLETAQAVAILDELAKGEGSLALVARFAKARFILRHPLT